MKIHTVLVIGIITFIHFSSYIPASKSIKAEYDYWIKGGVVIDGTGLDSYKADVLIRDGNIEYVGNVDAYNIKVNRTIDATGKVITPGFIDTHSHGNPIITPGFHNFLAMGVTTITLGQDGLSPRIGSTSAWMQEVENAQPSVNVIHFIGHGSMRRAANIHERGDLQASELNTMIDYINEAMTAGSFGMSTGLEYAPGIFAKEDELIALANAAGEHGGIIMSHIRNESKYEIENSITELLELGRQSDAPVHISHIKIVYSNETSHANRILSLLQNTRDSGQTVTADIYPYTASYTGIGIVFPEWAKTPHDYNEVVSTRREELADYLRRRVQQRNGPEATLFGTHPYAGKTLAQIAEEANKPFEDVLIDDIGPTGASAAYFVMDEKVMLQLLSDPYVMISSDGSPSMRHPRGYGSFAKIIRKYVVEEPILTLEEAIYKMSGLPAQTLGLIQERGIIKENRAADILIFDPEQIRDRADFENPHVLAEGFTYVMVNGRFAIDNGEITEGKTGIMLRK